MRTLLIGANGQLGGALAPRFGPAHAVTLAVRRNPKEGQVLLDLADPASIQAALREVRPDVILIAGAFCHVDLCETEPEACRLVNVAGPRYLAEYGRERGAWVVYYSTDHVFDGLRASYRETDAIHPLSLYARSKAEGEAVLRDLLPERHLILRTSWVYGPDREWRNFALRLVSRLRQGEEVVVPADQWGSPTYTEDLAQATQFLVEQGIGGTFHATGPDFVDRVTLARRICERFGQDAGRIRARPTSELGQAAPRPLRVRLDGWSLRETGAPPFRGIGAGLAALEQWVSTGERSSVSPTAVR